MCARLEPGGTSFPTPSGQSRKWLVAHARCPCGNGAVSTGVRRTRRSGVSWPRPLRPRSEQVRGFAALRVPNSRVVARRDPVPAGRAPSRSLGLVGKPKPGRLRPSAALRVRARAAQATEVGRGRGRRGGRRVCPWAPRREGGAADRRAWARTWEVEARSSRPS